MRRYSSSLLVQESGFHELIAEFNNGGGITRASLAREVVMVVSDAMKTFSQVIALGGKPIRSSLSWGLWVDPHNILFLHDFFCTMRRLSPSLFMC